MISLYKFLLAFIFLPLIATSQVKIGTPFNYLFDVSLNKINGENVFKEGTTYVVISQKSCAACVEYFTKSKLKVQYIFCINTETLLETKNIAATFFPGNSKIPLLFYSRDAINKEQSQINCDMKSPVILYFTHGALTLYDYEQVIALTNDFKLPAKKIKSKLKQA